VLTLHHGLLQAIRGIGQIADRGGGQHQHSKQTSI
jgi:hypothetical protein